MDCVHVLLQTQVFFNYFLFIAGAHLCLLCIHFAVMEINLNIVTAHVGGLWPTLMT